MPYELAKQLKDAGYPLVREDKLMDNDIFFPGEGIWYRSPTLEELIEACGNGFYTLLRGEGGTFATTDINGNVNAIGPTPEIAVANLWLALNKKNG